MNRKFEDKLAQLAFGDLSPDEAGKLEREAQSNPEAQQALSMYRDMRDGLKNLAEVPEDQFSKERLRDAILGQGLKPVPVRQTSPRAWLWMPVMACVLGFGLTLGRQAFMKPHVQPEVVMGTTVLKNSGIQPSTEPIRIVATNESGTKPTAPKAIKPEPKDPNEEPETKLALMPEDNGFDGGYTGGGMPNVDDNKTTIVTGPPTKVASNDPKPAASTSGPILLIDEHKDAETGASNATEVSSASNVLVGG